MYGDPTIISIREKIMSENSQRSKNNEFSDLESIRRIAYINFHNKNSFRLRRHTNVKKIRLSDGNHEVTDENLRTSLN